MTAHKTHDFCSALIADGWRSPDTYTKSFEPIAPGSAVYMFLLFDRKTDYETTIVAYVGMSVRLRQRLSNHNILPLLHNLPDSWVMRWFKPVRAPLLREAERTYIAKHNPPWNIIGRQRGLVGS